jgi:hypothetical protein
LSVRSIFRSFATARQPALGHILIEFCPLVACCPRKVWGHS